ncbi:MAG: YlxR family protein [Dehalococcoidia bacterium]|nr:YlxR family protein [Dehalococcoidia bacterium]
MKTLRVENRQQQQRARHVPERTCIACRRKAGKRELIRLVRSGEAVETDLRGKKPGRGVYLCLSSECWEKGLKDNHIERGLRIKLSADNRLLLLEYGRGLTKKESTK